MSAVEIEARAYGPDSSEEEIEAIRQRVYLHAEDVVMYREMPVQTPFHIDVFDERLKEVTAHLDTFSLLIDLTEAKPPNAEIRARLRKFFGSHQKMRLAAAFTGKNFVLNIAAKFVLSGMGLTKFTVHSTLDEALKGLADGA